TIRHTTNSIPFPYTTLFRSEVDINFKSHGDYRDIIAGIDRFSQANQLGQDLYQFTDNFTYIKGDHKLTFGTSNHLFHFSNLFVRSEEHTSELQLRFDLVCRL